MRREVWTWPLLVGSWLLGCAPTALVPPAAESVSSAAGSVDDTPGASTGAASARDPSAAPVEREPGPETPVVTVEDREALALIEREGGALHDFIDPAERETIAAAIEADLRDLARNDPRSGVGLRGNAHRLFDARWLRAGRFELIALVARPDRVPQNPGYCGETHLLYRLAYTAEVSGEKVSSRLPMTIAVILRGDRNDAPPGARGADRGTSLEGCRTAFRRWYVPRGAAGKELGQHLLGHEAPLRPEARERARLLELRINLQTVRWPSTVRPDLGGHAEYLLRSFRRGVAAALEPYRLENTPDVGRLRRDEALRQELLQWIGDPDHLAAIDEGTAVLPDRFSARTSVSVTPRGLSRRANRPFAQLFRPAELAALSFDDRRVARSPEALLRRLDDLSCAGCHQSRSIAGFHLLGDDGEDVAPGNALAVSSSPVLIEEEERRLAILEQVRAGRSPEFHRPPAERDPRRPGVWGARCGLGDPGFEAWTCAAGYRCEPFDNALDDQTVGLCMPAEGGEIGDACELGALRAHDDPHRDRISARRERPCAIGVCNSNQVGFPGGMCTTSCAELPEGGTCGLIAELRPFNDCLGRKTPFPRCLAEHVFEAGMRACDRERACREDYICARTPSGEGACIPPYFLFQMRVDGHP